MSYSIVISAHNKAHYIDLFLRRLRLTAPNAEFVLVDDGSTDGTGDIMRRHADVFLETPDVWETKANNAGLRAASGEYVAIVQDDDLVMSPGWLEIAAPAMQGYNIGILSGRGVGHYYRKSAAPLPDYPSSMDDNRGESLLIERNGGPCPHDAARSYIRYDMQKVVAPAPRMDFFITLCDATVRSPFIIARPLIEKIGYLDETFAPLGYDDHDYCFRARAAGFGVAFTFIPQSARFAGGSQALYADDTKRAFFQNSMNRNFNRVVERYYDGFPPENDGVLLTNTEKVSFWLPDEVLKKKG